jgi:hypothetical protein
MTLPDYNFLSAPLWLITTLHIVTLALHFLAMNIVLGGVVVLLVARISGKWNDPAVARIVKVIPSAMAATVTLGVAPLLFLQLAYYQQAYSASITSAWFWLLIVAAVIVAYYLLYGAAFAKGQARTRIPLLASLALLALLYVSWVYSSVFSMAERPDLYRGLYAANQSGWAVNGDAGTWVARWLHMLTGAVAVGGFMVGMLGRDSEPVYRAGRAFFLWGSVAAYIVGTAYLITLGDHLSPLMRSPAIWVLTVAVVLSAGALHFYFKRRFAVSALMVGLSVLGMVFVRHTLRLIVLDGQFDPGTIPVVPQWDVFALFLVFFLVALALIAYMLRLFVAGDTGRAG